MTKKYKIVFTGKFKDGVNHELVIENVSTMLRIEKEIIRSAIENKDAVKNNIDQSAAERYWSELNKLGVICKIYNEDHEAIIESNHKNTTNKNEIPRNENKIFPEGGHGNDPVNKTYNAYYIETFLEHKVKILIAFVIVTIVLFLSISTYNTYFTDEGSLKKRHAEYINAHRNYDVNKVYSFFTISSRNNISINDLESRVLRSAPDMRENIYAIIFHDNRTRAVIGVELIQGGEVVKRYTQTWLYIQDEWYRAYYEDNPEKRKSITASFDLQEYTYSWGLSDSNLSTKKLLRPEIRFKIRNNGEVPISYLKFKVQFYEKSENRIFSEEDVYAIGSNDIPLRKGVLSQTYFIKSGIGFDLSKMSNFSIDNQIYRDALSKKIKELTGEIYPSIFYKTESSGEWIEYSLQ